MSNENSGLPKQHNAPDSHLRQIFRFLSSMQLGIILLLLLAVISVYATLKEMEVAIRNIYSSWWFIGIMAFTGLNLFLCTAERVRPTWRQVFKPRRTVTVEAIKRMPSHRAVKVRQDGDVPLAKAARAMTASGLRVTGQECPVLFGEAGRLGDFGSLITHLSILLILLGAMYGALTGFEAQNGIGYAGTSFSVPEGRFQAEIGKVTMEYPDGPLVRPLVVSDVTVTRDGRIIRQGRIAINEPLRFEGISIYHSTFFWVLHLTITNPGTGVTEGPVRLYERDRHFRSDLELYIQTLAFFPDFTMNARGMPITRSYATNRPVLAYQIAYPDGTTGAWALLELNKPKMAVTRNGPLELTMVGFETAVVYSIIKNLGRPFLFTGAVLLIIGLYMSFFLFPRRVYAAFDDKSSTCFIGGRSRNKLVLEQLMDRIVEEIAESKSEGE